MATNTNALEFNGTSRYAKLSTASSLKGLENFTWMGWVKVGKNSKSQYQRAYVERQGSGSGIRFAVTPIQGKLRFELAVRDGSTDTNYDFSYTWDDYWHHVAFTGRVSGTNPSYGIYLDGVQVAEGKIVRTPEVEGDETTRPVSNTTPLGVYLGNHSLVTSGESFPSDRFWHGKLDDIIIFREALNQTDILTYVQSEDHYPDADAAILNTEDDPILSYYRFDNGASSSLTNQRTAITAGTSYTAIGAVGLINTTDRPFLGNGVLDTAAPTAPTAPTTTNVTSDGFTASWTAATDNVYVQFYEFHLSQFSNFSDYQTFELGQALTKTVTGLLPNVNYYWRVRAYDAKLNVSPYSSVQSLTTPAIGDVTPPSAPTGLTASEVSFSMWTLSWVPSASTDETGYKLDVARDAGFTQFLAGYRNRDVGNVTTTNVTGADPITTYFVRLRAYDAASNESPHSAVLTLQTNAIPDITPPLPVEVLDATSISSRGFTAHWEEAVDDTRVAGYYLDLSYDENFTEFVQTDTNYWYGADVGNVTAIRIEGLEPQTVYYYRLRAYDAAGNISEDNEQYAVAVTSPPSLDEGGYETSTLTPHILFGVDQNTPTAVDPMTAETVTVSASASSGEREAYLSFDLTPLVGRIQSAMLRLYITAATSEAVLRIAVDDLDVDTPVSWNNKPTVTGTELTTTIFAVDSWIDVDVSSLLTSGNTSYVMRLWVTGETSVTFNTLNVTDLSMRPALVTENDPQTATQVQRLTITDSPLLRRNHVINPSFEDGTLVGWFTENITTAVITDESSPHGTRYLRVIPTTTSTARMYTSQTQANASLGETWVASVALRQSVGTAGTVRLYIVEADDSGTALTSSSNTFTITSQWLRYETHHTVTNVNTTHVYFRLDFLDKVNATVNVDAALLEESNHDVPFFDGSTSGATWSGAANASTSTIPASRVMAISEYVGDANQNNTFIPLWKRVEDVDWFVLPDEHAIHERSLKYGTTVFGPAYGNYNLVPNPSFEVDTTSWVGTGTTVLNRAENPNAPSDYALSFSTVGGSGGVRCTVPVRVDTTPFLTGQAKVSGPVGSELRITVYLHSETWSVFESTTSTVAFGDESFVRLSVTHARVNATLPFATIEITAANTEGISVDVDEVQLQASKYLQPYRDGDHVDGIWQGTPHKSISGVMLSPLTQYVFAHAYTDEDGIYDSPSVREVIQADTHTTTQAPDDALTVYPIVTTASHTSLFVTIPYAGDDNADATCALRYTRSDQNSWMNAQPIFDREQKNIFATLTNLTPGTSYLIEATFTDPDGLFNTDNGRIEHTGVTTMLSDAPDGAARVTFGGFVLQGRPDDKIHVTYHDAFGFSERRVQVEAFPRVHGGIELENLWRPRTIRMEGIVEGDSAAELMDNLDSLKRALALRKQRLVIDSLANRRRFYTATCTVFDAPQQAGRNYRHLEWDAEFTCADPFAYDAVESTQPQVTLAVQSGSSTGTLSLSNDGDIEALPVITIGTASTSAITVTIINDSTGERITPATTIVRSDKMVIDSRSLSVQKNGVEIDYSGGFITLKRGGNSIRAELIGAGTPSILFSMRWYNRYL